MTRQCVPFGAPTGQPSAPAAAVRGATRARAIVASERASEAREGRNGRSLSLSLSVVDGGERARGRRESVVARETDRTTVRRLFHPRARARERDAGDAGDATRGESRRRNGTSGDV